VNKATLSRQSRLLLPALLLLLALLIPLLRAPNALAAPPRQEPPKTPSVVRGAAVWLENCTPCHGATGAGDGPTAATLQAPPANFADPEAARARKLADMFTTIKEGRMERFMPPWGARLSEEQIWDVAAYAESLSTPPETLDDAAAAYAENCAECHGADGVSDAIDLSNPATLASRSLQDLFDQLRPAQGDHASLADLPDETLWLTLIAARNFAREYPVLDGILRGTVVNGTTGEPVGDVTLTLHILSSNGDDLQTRTAVSAADGSFVFEKLNRDHTFLYALEGTYRGVRYVTPDPAVFIPDQSETTLDLTVYETTDDPASVEQSNLHRIIAFDATRISIADVYVFSNGGDRAYTGQPGADGLPVTVKIALPEQAENVFFRTESVRPADDGTYLDSSPIPPGQGSYSLFVTYDIPIAGKKKETVETPLFYDVGAVNMLAVDQGATIDSPQLSALGVEAIQGTDYMRFSGANLRAGESLVLEFGNLNRIRTDAPPGEAAVAPAETGPVNQNQLRWVILAFGLAMVAFSVWYAGRRQAQPVEVVSAEGERTRLLALLSELETLHQAGEVDDTTYHRLREQYRATLKRILAQAYD